MPKKLEKLTDSEIRALISDHLTACKKLASDADMKLLLFIIEMAIFETGKTKP